MPTYDYRCSACGKVFSKTSKIAEYKIPTTQPCPNCSIDGTVSIVQLGAPSLGDPVRLGVTKRAGGFNEVLASVHSKNANSKIDTYL